MQVGEFRVKESDLKLASIIRNYFRNRKALVAATQHANAHTKSLIMKAFDLKQSGYSIEIDFITTHKEFPGADGFINEMLDFRRGEFRIWLR